MGKQNRLGKMVSFNFTNTASQTYFDKITICDMLTVFNGLFQFDRLILSFLVGTWMQILYSESRWLRLQNEILTHKLTCKLIKIIKFDINCPNKIEVCVKKTTTECYHKNWSIKFGQWWCLISCKFIIERMNESTHTHDWAHSQAVSFNHNFVFIAHLCQCEQQNISFFFLVNGPGPSVFFECIAILSKLQE